MITTVSAICAVHLCAARVFFNNALLFLKVKRELSIIGSIYCDKNSTLC